MVLTSPARAYAPDRSALVRRALAAVRRWDRVPGSEVVGAWQPVTVWALLLVTGVVPAGGPGELGLAAVSLAAAGFLHGLLVVKPLAALGRWTARVSAWPRPVAVAVLAAPVSVPAAVVVRWWLGVPGAPGAVPVPVPGFGVVWAGCVAGAVLPLVVGALLRGRARPVPVGALWARGAVVAGTAVGVVGLASLVMDLPVP
ncbi:hypothetical protein QEZ40_005855 [Streptomyces katrae]|uniref:Yip1 domain-containing protein n=1 Tax=Streptomyces katrae TaxID=68223 RepID=A0ABT7H3V1_9ACTN|nr:hypothetical protein [Streptomyces katrae]MDK9500226.1 hypothetical protein [Streptomyces katrae]